MVATKSPRVSDADPDAAGAGAGASSSPPQAVVTAVTVAVDAISAGRPISWPNRRREIRVSGAAVGEVGVFEVMSISGRKGKAGRRPGRVGGPAGRREGVPAAGCRPVTHPTR